MRRTGRTAEAQTWGPISFFECARPWIDCSRIPSVTQPPSLAFATGLLNAFRTLCSTILQKLKCLSWASCTRLKSPKSGSPTASNTANKALNRSGDSVGLPPSGLFVAAS